jgi:hypothetical protein
MYKTSPYVVHFNRALWRGAGAWGEKGVGQEEHRSNFDCHPDCHHSMSVPGQFTHQLVDNPQALCLQEDWASEAELKSHIRSSCFTRLLLFMETAP